VADQSRLDSEQSPGIESAEKGLLGHPAVPYIAPFLGFLALLAARPLLVGLGRWQEPVRFLLVLGLIVYFSRSVISFKITNFFGSLAIGVATFLLWIGPDELIPGYRQHFLFSNSIVGEAKTMLAPEWQSDWIVLLFRAAIATLLVPILEELFWRNFLMRWLIDQDFWKVPIGTYTQGAFWITAALFAIEHGSYWEVGLLCGILWNWWMIKTKSLGDLIFVHAVTNGLLSVWVVTQGRWQYWM
jgi:uncharacterized protein